MADLDLDDPCADCGKTIQTLWCLAWEAYVCMWCRAKRTDRELSRKPGPVLADLTGHGVG